MGVLGEAPLDQGAFSAFLQEKWLSLDFPFGKMGILVTPPTHPETSL